VTCAASGREARHELQLQLPGRDVVLGFRKLDACFGVLEIDEVDVVEHVLTVRTLVAVALRKGTFSRLGAVNKTHNGIMRRYAPKGRTWANGRR
jgi:hypothetical protein